MPRSDVGRSMILPPTRMVPLVARSSPESSISSVLLPQPLGPMTETNSPSARSRSMALSASRMGLCDLSVTDMEASLHNPSALLLTTQAPCQGIRRRQQRCVLLVAVSIAAVGREHRLHDQRLAMPRRHSQRKAVVLA